MKLGEILTEPVEYLISLGSRTKNRVIVIIFDKRFVARCTCGRAISNWEDGVFHCEGCQKTYYKEELNLYSFKGGGRGRPPKSL